MVATTALEWASTNRTFATFCTTRPQARSSSTFRRSGALAATAILPAYCILLFDPADLEIHEHLQGLSRPSVRHLERHEAALNSWTDEQRAPTPDTLAYSAGVPARICEVLLSDLEEAGLTARDEEGGISIVVSPEKFKAGVHDLVAKLKTFRYEGERRLRLLADYAQSKECRSVFIRRYFGEDHPPRCGTCDRCRADRVGTTQPSPSQRRHARPHRRPSENPVGQPSPQFPVPSDTISRSGRQPATETALRPPRPPTPYRPQVRKVRPRRRSPKWKRPS